MKRVLPLFLTWVSPVSTRGSNKYKKCELEALESHPTPIFDPNYIITFLFFSHCRYFWEADFGTEAVQCIIALHAVVRVIVFKRSPQTHSPPVELCLSRLLLHSPTFCDSNNVRQLLSLNLNLSNWSTLSLPIYSPDKRVSCLFDEHRVNTK